MINHVFNMLKQNITRKFIIYSQLLTASARAEFARIFRSLMCTCV